jgi:hypothetical protein
MLHAKQRSGMHTELWVENLKSFILENLEIDERILLNWIIGFEAM